MSTRANINSVSNPFIEQARERGELPPDLGDAENEGLEKPVFDRSAHAKSLVEQGKLGGAEFGRLGGRPRKKRVGQVLVEEAHRKADDIKQVLIDAIKPTQDMKIRLEGVDKWMKLVQKEEHMQQVDEHAYAGKSSEELGEIIRAKLVGGGPVAELLAEALAARGAPIVDAEVVEE